MSKWSNAAGGSFYQFAGLKLLGIYLVLSPEYGGPTRSPIYPLIRLSLVEHVLRAHHICIPSVLRSLGSRSWSIPGWFSQSLGLLFLSRLCSIEPHHQTLSDCVKVVTMDNERTQEAPAFIVFTPCSINYDVVT